MSLWGWVFAGMYDRMLAGSERAGIAARRAELLAGTHGAVIEAGAGTGLNLPHYPAAVADLVLLEPDASMAKRLQPKVAASTLKVRMLRASAEAIPLADASFDFAVCTLVLCTVPDALQALRELRRVLKPNGRLLFLEHVRSGDQVQARKQDRIDPLWTRVGHGCHCNRDTLQAITGAGFAVDRLERTSIPKAAQFVRPSIVGSALVAPSAGAGWPAPSTV